MSRKANALKIGLFVIGALLLAVVAFSVLGSGILFEDRRQYVAYFEGAMDGLAPGSPVTYSGVKIGEVTAVHLEFDLSKYAARVPVFYFVDRGKVKFLGGKSRDVSIQELIHHGMRAKLVTLSLITGQQGIELTFQPDVPPVFVIPPGESPVPEVPVVASELETVKKRLEGLPLEALAQAALNMLTDIDTLVASKETKMLIASLAGASTDIQTVAHEDVGPALKSLKQMLDETATTAVTLRGALESVKADIDDVAHDVRGTAASATNVLQTNGPALRALLEHSDQTVQQARSSLAAVSSVIGPDRPVRADFDQLMRELSLTSRALRDLADELRRNPNLLITGKK